MIKHKNQFKVHSPIYVKDQNISHNFVTFKLLLKKVVIRDPYLLYVYVENLDMYDNEPY